MSYLVNEEWILVDRIDCSGATTPTFASGGNGVRNYPVSGNIDRAFKIAWDLTGNASGAVAQLELNGGTTNQTGTRAHSTGSAMSYTTYAHLGLVCDKNTASSRHTGKAFCWFASTTYSQARRFFIRRGSWGTTNVDAFSCGLYNDTSTDITSIRFNVTTGTVTGKIWLYVRNPQQAP